MNTNIHECRSFRADKLNAYVFDSRRHALGAAAAAVAAETRRLIAERGRAIVVFSSAPSQAEFLDELAKAEEIEWTRVIGFHLDERLGADEDSPQSHRRFLIDRLISRVPMAEFHGLRGEAANPEAVCANYATLLKSRPPDFAALDLGEIQRLTSIDPLNDPLMVRVIEFDGPSRRAISLTISAIMACPKLFLIAADATTRRIGSAMIEGEIATACPTSILRTHEDAHMFI